MAEKDSSAGRWTWARPDVRTYALMVQRLVASLRVSDALTMISYVSRMGVSSGEEVMLYFRCIACVIFCVWRLCHYLVTLYIYIYIF